MLRLKPLHDSPYETDVMALSQALSWRGLDVNTWIVRDSKSGKFFVCCEDETGSIVAPVCMAWLGVFTETDRFTDPIHRINLGPGVWPNEEE